MNIRSKLSDFKVDIKLKQEEIKRKMHKKKIKFKDKTNQLIKCLKTNVEDVLIVLAIIIGVVNSCDINIHFGMYVLTGVLIFLSYIVRRNRTKL